MNILPGDNPLTDAELRRLLRGRRPPGPARPPLQQRRGFKLGRTGASMAKLFRRKGR